MDLAYETTPEMPDFVWISSSVVFALEFCIGGVTNLTIVFCYLKNISVRWSYIRQGVIWWSYDTMCCIPIYSQLTMYVEFQVWDDFTILLMNMIFAEMIMALVGIPINFIASIQRGWKMGKIVCDVSGFLVTLEGKSRILTSILQSFWLSRCF